MKFPSIFQLTVLACAALYATNNAFSASIYVDNSSSGCSPQSSTCTGSSSTPFKKLSDGVSNLTPGSTLYIKNTGIPYYIYDGGIAPNGTTQFPDALISGSFSSTGTTPATVIQGVNPTGSTGNPTLRGTIKIGGWTSLGSGRYSLSWTTQRNDGNGILDPQQIFRTGLSGQPDIQLKQRGGQVYGGYPDYKTVGNGYPGIPTDMTIADSSAGPSGLWPDRNLPANSAPSFTNGIPNLNGNEFYFHRTSNINTLYIKVPTTATSTSPGDLAPNEKLEISVMRYLVKIAGANKLQINNLTFERTNTSSYSRESLINSGTICAA